MTVAFAYLLSLIFLHNILKRLLKWIMIIKVARISANLVPNYPLAPKGRFFVKLTNITFAITLAQIGAKMLILPMGYFWGKLNVTTVYLLCSIMLHFQKLFREQIKRQGCIILVHIGRELKIS